MQQNQQFENSSGQATPTEEYSPAAEPYPPSTLFSPTPYKITQISLMNRWDINSFSQLKEKDFGPKFQCGNASWRILIFPNGNRNQGAVSIFLENIESTEKSGDEKWSVCAEFSVALVNSNDDTIYKNQIAVNRFTPQCTDWGFSSFIKTTDLTSPISGRPLLENDSIAIVVSIRVFEDETGYLFVQTDNWDSKKETGFVGLKNQGATCYMNSLLQSLYFTPYFRRATFQIPTEDDVPTKSVALALQRVFYNLQYSDNAVGTTELTKSFGWDTLDSFMQHDVQEFNRVLQDNLESKMKGTKAERAISLLFEGKMKSYIKCINVDFESSRIEDYYDIQLNVKGCKDLKESFINYCAVETLEGENKYMAEGFGLQDARKGVIFESFPPVLHLQLKRFEYDMERDAMVKINDRHEFPSEIELDEFLNPDSPDCAIKQKYFLHGVLVHMGDLHGGHYLAYILPEKNGKWFKFDDDKVVPASTHDVYEQNFGGAYPFSRGGGRVKRFSNAYMLVYIREDRLDDILKPVTMEDIPPHLIMRIQEEKHESEQRAKAIEEESLYFYVHVLTDQIISAHEGYDLCNLDNKAYPITKLETIKLKRDITLGQFKSLLCNNSNIPEGGLRLWSLCTRQNKTTRPDHPLNEPDNILLDSIRAKYSRNSSEYVFYVEKVAVSLNSPTKMMLSKEEPSQGMTLFLKYYDYKTCQLKYIGNFHVKNKMKPMIEILPILHEKLSIPIKVPLKLYEEVKPGMIDVLNLKNTYLGAELSDGDIIIVETELSDAESKMFSLPNVLKYFEDYDNRITVNFVPRIPSADSKDIVLVMSKKYQYPQVVSRLSKELNVSANRLLLSQYGAGNQRHPILYSETMTLQEMLGVTYYPAPQNTLYYEVLNMTIHDYESRKSVRISYIDSSVKEQGPFDLFVLKTSTMGQVIEELLTQAVREVNGTGKLRIYEVSNHRIYKVCSVEDALDSIPYQTMLYVEEIPIEELEMEKGDKLVQVYHYSRDALRGHGIPFYFVLKTGEMFSESKKRLQNRAGLSDKEFSKIKFTMLNREFEATEISDDDILADLDINASVYLGMDHLDKSSRTGRQSMGKSIKIFN